jgi:hypothetical protein
MNKKIMFVALFVIGFAYLLIGGKLGDGYKDAKWGMTKSQVKSILAASIISQSTEPNDEGDTSIIFDLGNGKKLSAFFYNNKFYDAEFEPGLGDDDHNGVDAIIEGLYKKYGKKFKSVPNMVNVLHIPLRVAVWDDGVTKITLQMQDPAVYNNTYPSSTLIILYESDKIEEEKKISQRHQENENNEKEKKKTLKRVQDDL